MKAETKLARVFSALAEQDRKSENTAADILTIVRQAKVKDVEGFDPLVKAAYEANGWNTGPGRPANGNDDKEGVPATIRTYVTAIRRALRAGIVVGRMKSMYDVRKALTKKAARRTSTNKRRNGGRIPKEVQESFVGIALEAPKQMNGALIHDLGAVYIALPEDHRSMLGRQLARLLNQYRPLAKGIAVPPKPAPVEQEKKAA